MTRLLPLADVPVEALDASWEDSARAASRPVQDELLVQADRLRGTSEDADSWRCLTAYRALVERLEVGSSDDVERAAWTVQEDPARDEVSRRLALLAVRHAGVSERIEAERMLAECDLRAGRLPESEQRLRRLMALVRGRGDAVELSVTYVLAQVFALQRRELESLVLARRSQEIADRRPDLHVVHLAHATTALGDAYRSLEDDGRMVWCAQRLLALGARLPEPDGSRLRRHAQLLSHDAALLRGDLPSARDHLEAAVAWHQRDLKTAGHAGQAVALAEAAFALRMGDLARLATLLAAAGPENRVQPGTWAGWDVLGLELLLRTKQSPAAHALARACLERLEEPDERQRLGTGGRLRAAEAIGALLSGPGGDSDLAGRAFRDAADAAFDRLAELERCVDDLPELSETLPDDREALSEYRQRFLRHHQVVLQYLHDLLVGAAAQGRLPGWVSSSPGGMTAVCAWCRCVRGLDGRWLPLGHLVHAGALLNVTHGICDRCAPGVRSDLSLQRTP